MRAAALLPASALLAACAGADAMRTGAPTPAKQASGDAPFWFGFIGDTAYNALEEKALDQILMRLGEEGLDFVVHVGDVKSGSGECSDALLDQRFAQLDRSPVPLIYTPGDNEWTDCHRAARVSGDERTQLGLERLQWIRRRVFAERTSLGSRRIALDVQSWQFPENRRWRHGSLQLMTLHVVGSDNAREQTGLSRTRFAERQAANLAWLGQTLALARRESARGLAIALHADLEIERNDPNDGFAVIRQALVKTARDFGGPVLLMHGDSHVFRSDRPWARTTPPNEALDTRGVDDNAPNLRRVECFGSPLNSSWVQIRWNPDGDVASEGSDRAAFFVTTRQL